MITGEKTIIKGITKDCASQIYCWVNQEELRSLTGTLYPISEYEHEDWIKKVTTGTSTKLFMICDKESNEPIGTIGLKNFDFINRNVELFVSIGNLDFISSTCKKGGYGTDAVLTMVKYCFETLNMHKVSLRVFESNTRAIRCYEKCGFKKEGVLIDQHFQKGRYENTVIMGVIAPEQYF